MANQTIQAKGSDGSVAGTTKTNDIGIYTITLKPGHYVLDLVPQLDTYHIMNKEIDLNTYNNRLDLTLNSNLR